MVRRHVLDLTLDTVCGDPAAYIARLLRDAKPGDLIVVRTRLPLEELRSSLSLLEATGRIIVIQVVEKDGVTEVVLRVEG